MGIQSKGDVHLPEVFLAENGLRPGDDPKVVVEGKSVRIAPTDIDRELRRSTTTIRALRACATEAVTTDMVMALTRGE